MILGTKAKRLIRNDLHLPHFGVIWGPNLIVVNGKPAKIGLLNLLLFFFLLEDSQGSWSWKKLNNWINQTLYTWGILKVLDVIFYSESIKIAIKFCVSLYYKRYMLMKRGGRVQFSKLKK